MSIPRTLFALALTALHSAIAISTVEVKGSKFFTSEGNQIFIKGILYNGGDGLTNATQCAIDAKLMRQLGANVVRTEQSAFNATTADCIKAFEEQELYLLASLGQLKPSNLNNEPTWTTNLRDGLARNLDELHQYDNLLGLYIMDWADNTWWSDAAAPVLKAAVADLKAYRDAMRYRKIPVGIFHTALTSRPHMDFFDCGNGTVAADFYSMTASDLCRDTDFATSSFNEFVDIAGSVDAPVFIADNTCPGSRPFSDQPWILGEWSDRLSGNILTEWYRYFSTSEEVSEMSFVNYTHGVGIGTPSLFPAYSTLSSQWATLIPSGMKATAYTPTATKRACPTSASDWALDERAGTDIPTLGLSGLTTATPSSTKGTGDADNANSSDKANLGAIFGGAVGGVVALIMIVAIFCFIRRRNKKTGISAMQSNKGAWSDKIFDAPNNRASAVQLQGYPELNGNRETLELHGEEQVAGITATEVPSHERAQELLHDQEAHRGSSVQSSTERLVPDQNLYSTPSAPSAHVQAQIQREVNWLAQEEARLREQRERLMRQD